LTKLISRLNETENNNTTSLEDRLVQKYIQHFESSQPQTVLDQTSNSNNSKITQQTIILSNSERPSDQLDDVSSPSDIQLSSQDEPLEVFSVRSPSAPALLPDSSLASPQKKKKKPFYWTKISDQNIEKTLWGDQISSISLEEHVIPQNEIDQLFAAQIPMITHKDENSVKKPELITLIDPKRAYHLSYVLSQV
jgi:hypothetical protein